MDRLARPIERSVERKPSVERVRLDRQLGLRFFPAPAMLGSHLQHHPRGQLRVGGDDDLQAAVLVGGFSECLESLAVRVQQGHLDLGGQRPAVDGRGADRVLRGDPGLDV